MAMTAGLRPRLYSDCVGNEIDKNLSQERPVRFQRRQRVFFPDDVAALQFRLKLAQDILDQRPRIKRRNPHLTQAQAGEGEQVVDQPGHASRRVDNPAQIVRIRFRKDGCPGFGEEFCVAADVAKGGAQIMGNSVGKGLQFFIDSLE